MSNVIPITVVPKSPDEDWTNKTNGLIFEFKDIELAKAFAAVVKGMFNLNSRVFDNAEAAAKAHMFPWEQYPPVLHIDRPWWDIPDHMPKEE